MRRKSGFRFVTLRISVSCPPPFQPPAPGKWFVIAHPAPGRATSRKDSHMKAVVWHGPADVRVDEVEDPKIEEPTDAVIKITSTAICGSDLHLYEILAPFMAEGDILGHEPMGIVEEVGSEVTHIKPGDRVVIPFNISCGNCWMFDQD